MSETKFKLYNGNPSFANCGRTSATPIILAVVINSPFIQWGCTRGIRNLPALNSEIRVYSLGGSLYLGSLLSGKQHQEVSLTGKHKKNIRIF